MDELERIERRLKLHDIRVLMSVVEMGSMNKAAERLGTSQPAVSRAISDLERVLGVSLLDRSPAGVEPTAYARALVARGLAAFDELKQGIKDIEFLADPSAGVLRIGWSESLADAFVPTVIDELTQKHPRLSFHVLTDFGPPIFDQLAARNVELVICRVPKNATEKYMVVENLFNVSHVIAAGPQNRWLRRRNIELAELSNEPWTLPPFDSFASAFIAEAFRAKGLDPPRIAATTVSRTMRSRLLATGRFLTMLPDFSIEPDRYPFLRKLPVKLPDNRAPVSVVTIKNKALSPPAHLFLDTFRAVVARSLTKRTSSREARPTPVMVRFPPSSPDVDPLDLGPTGNARPRLRWIDNQCGGAASAVRMQRRLTMNAGSRRNVLRGGAAAALLAVATLPGYAQSPAQGAKPNVVIILADDLGNADLGYRGGYVRTPNIDKLASDGVRAESFYGMPVCTPSRAQLMTGRYAMRHGLQTLVIFPSHSYGLPTDERTLPQALKEAGYKTAMVGKWHLGHADRKYWPQN